MEVRSQFFKKNQVKDEVDITDLKPYYSLKMPDIKDMVVLGISRFATLFMTRYNFKNWRKRDKIGQHLILSCLPGEGEAQEIKDYVKKEFGPNANLKGVLAVIADEHSTSDVESPEAWENARVKFRKLLMPDFTFKASIKQKDAALNFITECLRDNDEQGVVLVHCKAGRSRSAAMVIAWLWENEDPDYLKTQGIVLSKKKNDLRSDILKLAGYVKSLRPQVGLLSCQTEGLVELLGYRLDNSNKLISDPEITHPTVRTPEKLKEEFQNLLKSPQIKCDIIEFQSFADLSFYAYNNQEYTAKRMWKTVMNQEQKEPRQIELIREFFMSIYNANNPNWYLNLVNSIGPMRELKELKTYYYSTNILSGFTSENKEDQSSRKRYINNFITELNSYLVEALECNLEDIKKMTAELNQPVVHRFKPSFLQTDA